MDLGQLPEMAFVIAAVCFIFSLGGLSQHETARRGNLMGIIGMSLAIFATLLKVGLELAEQQTDSEGSRQLIAGGALLGSLVVGAGVGVFLAMRVEMTDMPQLVAILHSFVGLAAVLVGFNSHFELLDSLAASRRLLEESGAGPVAEQLQFNAEACIHQVEVFVGVFIGALTFTGSIIAWGKLQGVIGSQPLLLPGRHLMNVAALLLCLLLGFGFVALGESAWTHVLLILCTLIAFAIGAHLVMAIGGADMPVVVSMLNSYSGWAAAATGFMLSNDLLIVTGALVGSSGAILSYIMCRAMNRSFLSVILGGFGVESGTMAAGSSESLSYNETSIAETAESLFQAREVIIVPGYGMAVAQAQHPVREITDILKKKGTRVRFAIHPVAGRLPGHMNVLLAEAHVPYDVVLEMDEINEDFPDTDVVLVIGANDIVNPGALDDPASPIYRMPVLHAWEAGEVVILKRSMATGYSGIDNPLFYKENSQMLFGDAKSSVDGILTELRNRTSG
ncbi:MAG: NAD(P)(+) transhydrogenase (Re/Si-specific) subunit beta [Planctomycetota bacterium]|nr:NAD(P)(+) transhydrogenase (Re/Si-specific) subunit beta [Planctomycetota bacterium]